jgi:hypothetical protein
MGASPTPGRPGAVVGDPGTDATRQSLLLMAQAGAGVWSDPAGARLASCSGDFTVRVWDSLSPQDRDPAPADRDR